MKQLNGKCKGSRKTALFCYNGQTKDEALIDVRDLSDGKYEYLFVVNDKGDSPGSQNSSRLSVESNNLEKAMFAFNSEYFLSSSKSVNSSYYWKEK